MFSSIMDHSFMNKSIRNLIGEYCMESKEHIKCIFEDEVLSELKLMTSCLRRELERFEDFVEQNPHLKGNLVVHGYTNMENRKDWGIGKKIRSRPNLKK